jgi:hypothetical protein
MELSGFRIIDVEPPSPDVVEKVVRAFGERPLALGGSTTHVYGKQECEDFLQSGLSTSVSLHLYLVQVRILIDL